MGSVGRRSLYPLAKTGIMEFIENRAVGSDGRLASEKEFCELLGVSRPLVRRALKELAQEGKIVSRPGKGHFVLSPFQPAPAGVVSVVLGSTGPRGAFEDPHVTEILHGIQREFVDTRFRGVWETIGPRHRPVSSIIKPHLSDLRGAILVPLGKQSPELMAEALPAGLRCAVIGRSSWREDIPSVQVDHAGGSRLAVRHLVRANHRRIGCISVARVSPVYLARQQAFADELIASGIAFDPDLVVTASPSNHEHAVQAIVSLLDRCPDITALFISCAFMLLSCLSALERKGIRYPEDMDLICFDESPLAKHHVPPIPVVRQPSEEMGRLGTRMLLEILDGRMPEKTSVMLSTEIVIRQ